MATTKKVAPVVPAALGGVAVEYDDRTNTNFGLIRVVCEPQVSLSAAGVAAVLTQASTYLTSAKVAALLSAGAPLTVDVTVNSVQYPVLAADAAAQSTALQAVVTSANLSQTGGFPR